MLALVADLGGQDALSHAQLSVSLSRRAVWLELRIEHEASRIAEGGGSTLVLTRSWSAAWSGSTGCFGLKRQARNVTLRDVWVSPRLTQQLRRSQRTTLAIIWREYNHLRITSPLAASKANTRVTIATWTGRDRP